MCLYFVLCFVKYAEFMPFFPPGAIRAVFLLRNMHPPPCSVRTIFLSGPVLSANPLCPSCPILL